MVSLTLKLMLISLVLYVGVEASPFHTDDCASKCRAVQCRNAMQVTCNRKCLCSCRTPWEVRQNKYNCPKQEHGGFETNPTFASQGDMHNFPH
uniref:NP1 n=1 Tax=Hapalochlaena maculosa TaxID=61716 RepID=B6Z1Y7_HAPMA|nr:NP1 [Hapalochlaena maculosa]